jgi:ribosome biogenesis GTPase / thiamine phosphate phosphatase
MAILEEWGWNAEWAAAAAEHAGAAASECGRVIGQDRDRWVVQLHSGPSAARVSSGSLSGSHPVTGDWVVTRAGPASLDPISILAVLPRRSAISRGAAGSGATEQVLAANIDVVWIVHGLDTPINLRRLERYLAIAWESGAIPEVVLTKLDLAHDVARVVQELGPVVPGVAVHMVSAEQPESIDALRTGLLAGRTVALIGPSGAGKSTLINALAAIPLAATGSVRERDGKGRHTTTRRALFRIPGGALLLDTPGLRELRVWDLSAGLAQAFPDIASLSTACRFRDCRHEVEPGCAVVAAAASGDLEPSRLESFRKLTAEAAYALRRVDPEARASAVAKHKTALKTLKYHPKYRRED